MCQHQRKKHKSNIKSHCNLIKRFKQSVKDTFPPLLPPNVCRYTYGKLFEHLCVDGISVRMKTWCFSCQMLLFFFLVYCCTVCQPWPAVLLSLIIYLRVSNAIWIQGAPRLAFAPCTSPLSIPGVCFNPRTFEGILFAGCPRARVRESVRQRMCVYKLVELKYSQARWGGVLFIARIGEYLSLQLAQATRQINSAHQI